VQHVADQARLEARRPDEFEVMQRGEASLLPGGQDHDRRLEASLVSPPLRLLYVWAEHVGGEAHLVSRSLAALGHVRDPQIDSVIHRHLERLQNCQWRQVRYVLDEDADGAAETPNLRRQEFSDEVLAPVGHSVARLWGSVVITVCPSAYALA